MQAAGRGVERCVAALRPAPGITGKTPLPLHKAHLGELELITLVC